MLNNIVGFALLINIKKENDLYRSLGKIGRAALGGISALILGTSVMLAPQSVQAGNTPAATIGAIRWDAWTGPCSGTGCGEFGDIGWEVERNLSYPGTSGGPFPYYDRIPFYGTATGSGFTVRETSQANMDKDIDYAKQAGINYWAFTYYDAPMNQGRNLYLSSTHKAGLNFTYIVGCCSYPTAATIVSDMASSSWQKVLKGRPLLYIYTGGTESQDYISDYVHDIKAGAVSAGMAEPYIVLQNLDASWVSGRAAYVKNGYRSDAIGAYADGGSNGEAFSNLVSRAQTHWADHRDATGVHQVVPWVTTGWDNRPRSNYNNSFVCVTTPPAPCASNAYAATATPAAIGSFLQTAVDWVSSNQNYTDANTVLMYAWNELDEGGWLTPTLQNGTDRVAAVSQAVKYASTSNYDSTPTYTADKAFDGDWSTAWQSAGGLAYSSHRLEVDFGQDMTFSQVNISEYGTRTSAFDIEYMQGNTWKTATSVTSASIAQSPSSSTYSFTAVTGRKARIKFNSGTYTPIIYEFSTNASPSSLTNVARNKEYSASSQWDASQAAQYAFDGSAGTNWQAANSLTAQWLQVNFGARKAFNTVKLSEYGDRTTSFQLKYWNGTAWQVAYTGTTIGSAKTINLSSTIVSDKLQLYWPTSGMSLSPIIYEMEVEQN